MDYPNKVRRDIALTCIVVALTKCVGLEAIVKIKDIPAENTCPETPVFYKELQQFADMRIHMLMYDTTIVVCSLVIFCLSVISIARENCRRLVLYGMAVFLATSIGLLFIEFLEIVVHRSGVYVIVYHFFAPFPCFNQSTINTNVSHYVLFLISVLLSFVFLVSLFKKIFKLHSGIPTGTHQETHNEWLIRNGLEAIAPVYENQCDGLPSYEQAVREFFNDVTENEMTAQEAESGFDIEMETIEPVVVEIVDENSSEDDDDQKTVIDATTSDEDMAIIEKLDEENGEDNEKTSLVSSIAEDESADPVSIKVDELIATKTDVIGAKNAAGRIDDFEAKKAAGKKDSGQEAAHNDDSDILLGSAPEGAT
ncbi:hypothetical protein CAEBREN_13831 [Caenorhabditis brenneri]|uniref:Uncharacterized protein n=1 Tax=Caenorhabditis brenneri TaxID=135651 RepID=G0NKY4_CAEBE|nr:hypothetical protein CAEBREN_13831 [Caenorhabditis brenneri]